MSCKHKHTGFQPTDGQWRCPKCGSKDFAINTDFEDEEALDCPLLHSRDIVNCYDCGYGATGTKVANDLRKTLGEVDFEAWVSGLTQEQMAAMCREELKKQWEKSERP